MSLQVTKPAFLSLRTALLALLLPLTMAAKGDGCSSPSEQSPAPDVTGQWAIRYGESIAVTIEVGGAVYNASVGIGGGIIEVMHESRLLRFNLDCSRPEIVCPSEAWPTTINVSQHSVQYENRIVVELPEQSCTGELRDPLLGECGEGTLNEFCEPVCDGEILVQDRDRFGVIAGDGRSFDLFLGAGIASNGVNCALLGFSLAYAELVNSGEEGGDDWRSIEMANGEIIVSYGGACLYADDASADEELKALLLDVRIEFDTGFTGLRVE